MVPRVVAVLALPVLVGLWTTPAAAFDASIERLHVTQSVQGADDTTLVPLIANRSTAVRAVIFVAPSSAGEARPNPPPALGGTVEVFVGDQRVTPAGGVAATGNSTLGRLGESSGLDFPELSLNFELPAPTGIAPPSGATQAENVRVRVVLEVAGDTNSANNGFEVSGLKVLRRPFPAVRFVPIDFHDLIQPSPVFMARGRGDAFLRSALPIDDSCPACVYAQQLATHRSPQLFTPISAVPGGWDLLGILLNIRTMEALGNRLPGDDTMLFGWVRRLASDHLGMALPGANVGYGAQFNPVSATSTETTGQGTLAHEALHLRGLVPNTFDAHNAGNLTISSQMTAMGWDFRRRLIDNPVSNAITTQVKTRFLDDLMNPSRGAFPQMWVSPLNYLAAVGEEPIAIDVVNGSSTVVQGSFDPGARDRIVDFRLLRLPGGGCIRRKARGVPQAFAVIRYVGRVIDPCRRRRVSLRSARTAATLRVPLDAVMHIDAPRGRGGSRNVQGPFTAQIPVEGEILSARIVHPGGRTLAARTRNRPPRGGIIASSLGSRLRRPFTLRWKLADRDTRASSLRSFVLFSPDRGRNYYAVAPNLRTRSLDVDPTRLPRTKSRGAGILRVLLSDGMSTSAVQTGGLTNDVGRFRPPRR